MAMSRRGLVRGLLGTQVYAAAAKVMRIAKSDGPPSATALPDKREFPFEGVYLNAAFTHPLGLRGQAAATEWFASRMHEPTRPWPRTNPRNQAVEMFAGLIHAAPSEIAVVPSTMGGENLVVQAMGLGPDAGVVTDAFHYDASIAMYGELKRGGVPVEVVAPRENRIDLNDLDALIGKQTRLVAVSLVSSMTGYQHDLKKLCEVAHAKGAMVYADIVQAAGALPIDVKASGVDFCCCGTYKWLMGDFGVGFLYVRPDRLGQMRHLQYGWRQVKSQVHHVFPGDAPGSALGEWTLGTDTASVFEVGTPDWSALAVTIASIGYVRELGVEAIARYRRPMLDRLQDEMPKLGFEGLTPREAYGPTAAFFYKGAAVKFGPVLERAKIKVTLYENMVRVSPSVYNDLEDIERLLSALKG